MADTATTNIFGPDEPARDEALGALLAGIVGTPPVGDVDWAGLSARITAARGRQRATWWSYAARWERRAVPVALAASLAGLLALWGLGMPSPARAVAIAPASEAVAALVAGTPTDDVARSFTSTDDLVVVEAY